MQRRSRSYSAHDFSHPPTMWEPKDDIKLSVKDFWNYISQKYNVKIDNYWDLHRWSIENLSDFWKEMWDYVKVIYSKPYDEVLDKNASMADTPEWFKGARLNYAENVLRYRDDHVALIIDGEDRESKNITYSQLYIESCKYGAALRRLGLKKNDTVVCYMSNREEAIFAMLGVASIGAIWSGALPLYGCNAAINRFLQTSPKFLFTTDRFVYDGEEKNLLEEKLPQISKALPSLEKIIIVPSKPDSTQKNISNIQNGCFLEEFLSYGVDEDNSVPDLIFEQLPFNHPVCISYTSGTTGNPKALVHGFGMCLGMARDFWIHNNGSRDSTWLSASPVGWATWNMFTSLLMNGMTVVIFDGLPFFISPTYLWDLVDKYSLSHLFLTASCLDDLEKKGYVPTEKNHLSSLEAIVSGASVVKLQNYEFVYKKIKSNIMFGSIYGSTELMGSCLVFERSLPVYKGEISAPTLGVDVKCFNGEGKPVEGERGELVILTPTPSLPVCLWNDTNGIAYKKNYFSEFSENVFAPGDICMINPVTKGVIIFGRSDDTLKQRGARFGSSEIYNVVNIFPEIRDSLCVSQYNGRGDERAVLFLKMRNGHLYNEDLVWQIQKAIERELSKRHVPDVIIEIEDIPHNMNGKKMEIIVKKIINGMAYNSDSVVNPECLEFYQEIPKLKESW